MTRIKLTTDYTDKFMVKMDVLPDESRGCVKFPGREEISLVFDL